MKPPRFVRSSAGSGDGVEVAGRDIGRPAYRKHHPNGEDCDGDYFCRSATVTIELEPTP